MNKIQIELEHKQLTNSRLTTNEIDVAETSLHNWTIENSQEFQKICVFFEPWGIDPLLRINGFLINKWLGNVEMQSHCLQFSINQDFFKYYREKDLQGRIDSLGTNNRNVTIDRVIGRSSNSDLVAVLKEKIIEKSNIS
jgi:hypothetical protein